LAGAGAFALVLSFFVGSSAGQTGGAAAPGSVPTYEDTSGTEYAPPPTTTRKQLATWYGPGFWGHRTACGMRLRKRTIGVAHKRLPCGAKVTFYHRGRQVTTRVIDRGPYVSGYKWDLTKRLARRLDFVEKGSGWLRAAVHG
jgi:rare lipoprotein A (peptidoglycan hydrolase)